MIKIILGDYSNAHHTILSSLDINERDEIHFDYSLTSLATSWRPSQIS